MAELIPGVTYLSAKIAPAKLRKCGECGRRYQSIDVGDVSSPFVGQCRTCLLYHESTHRVTKEGQFVRYHNYHNQK